MTPRLPAGPARAFPLLVALVVLTAGGGAAAIAWTAQSTLATSATSAPVELELGAGAAKTRYFAPLSLGANRTMLTGTLSGKAGADLVVKDVVRVVNRDTASHAVTLTATQVTSSRVEVFAWTVRDGATTVGVVDNRAASPSLAFTLAAGASRTLDLRLDLADGAGLNDALLSFDLRLGVAP